MIPRPLHSLAALCLVPVAIACGRNESPSAGFAGTWVMTLDQRTFIVLTLENEGDTLTGTLRRPEHFQTSDGMRFSGIGPGVTTEVVVSASILDERLRFVTEKRDDPEDRTEYDMTLAGENGASVTIPGLPIEAWSFTRIRAARAPAIAADWDPERSYSQERGDGAVESDAEMKTIYEADQKVRQDPASISDREWDVIGRQDAERRSRTLQLLSDGRLRTGEDFTRAAFVLQHGSNPGDYLLAHTLAMVAVAEGNDGALWIGAASLDRYLHASGEPQIFGTQFKRDPDGVIVQEPYDRDLVADELRRRLGVPTIAAQQDQLKYWTEQFESAGR